MSSLPIRSVAVLGAGTMGTQIAAHFANAGVPAMLLDLTGEVAFEGVKRARALKPDPFFLPDTARLIATGGFDTDLKRVADADWIIEAVGHSRGPDRGGPQRRLPPALARHALLQSSAVPASARSDPHRRDGSR